MLVCLIGRRRSGIICDYPDVVPLPAPQYGLRNAKLAVRLAGLHGSFAMTITESEIWALLIGAGIVSIIVYWSTTREKRIVSSVRSEISFLGSYNDMTPVQWRKISGAAPSELIEI